MWWPNDRSWFVASEIDFYWTYVGGPEELIESIRADNRLETWLASPTDTFWFDGSDLINEALN